MELIVEIPTRGEISTDAADTEHANKHATLSTHPTHPITMRGRFSLCARSTEPLLPLMAHLTTWRRLMSRVGAGPITAGATTTRPEMCPLESGSCCGRHQTSYILFSRPLSARRRLLCRRTAGAVSEKNRPAAASDHNERVNICPFSTGACLFLSA